MKRRIGSLVAATAAALAATTMGAAPASAAADPSCTGPIAAAVQVTPHPLDLQYDFIDVATAEAVCVDLELGSHTGWFEFDWYYDDPRPTYGYEPMPSCQNIESVHTPSVAGQLVVAGVATCQRPPDSLAWERNRWVEITFYVDGDVIWNTTVPVLLTPTPV